jgi:hypothetical protein
MSWGLLEYENFGEAGESEQADDMKTRWVKKRRREKFSEIISNTETIWEKEKRKENEKEE